MNASGFTAVAMGVALSCAWAEASAQAFSAPSMTAPPIPGASPVINPDYPMMMARAKIWAAQDKPNSPSIYKDTSGNVFVNGQVRGPVIVSPQIPGAKK